MPVESVEPGDIVVLSGIEAVKIGDTICTKEQPKALPRISVDEPTVSMRFAINTSPLAGREGKLVQANKIRERLEKEALMNVAIRVEDGAERDSFIVKGRGEFQMAILVETMRREGFELTVGRPEVILKKVDDKVLEPIERLFVDCGDEFTGVVTEKISARKGRMVNMTNNGSGRVRMEFSVPSRSLIGYRDEFLTDTKGTGLLNSYLEGYGEHRGEFPTRRTGSIVADRAGSAVAYGLFHLEPRGELFVVPGDPIYDGMIVGERNKAGDIEVNPCKEKKLTNMRASGKDEALTLTPVRPMSLERAIHFIGEGRTGGGHSPVHPAAQAGSEPARQAAGREAQKGPLGPRRDPTPTQSKRRPERTAFFMSGTSRLSRPSAAARQARGPAWPVPRSRRRRQPRKPRRATGHFALSPHCARSSMPLRMAAMQSAGGAFLTSAAADFLSSRSRIRASFASQAWTRSSTSARSLSFRSGSSLEYAFSAYWNCFWLSGSRFSPNSSRASS